MSLQLIKVTLLEIPLPLHTHTRPPPRDQASHRPQSRRLPDTVRSCSGGCQARLPISLVCTGLFLYDKKFKRRNSLLDKARGPRSLLSPHRRPEQAEG